MPSNDPHVLLHAPPEAIQFGHTLHCVLKQIVTADPAFGPVFLDKVDLADAYMQVWIQLEDIPTLVFIVPLCLGDTNALIGFHNSILMECIESALLFCATTKTVGDLANTSWEPNFLALPQAPACFTMFLLLYYLSLVLSRATWTHIWCHPMKHCRVSP
eukprot:6134676-Ditylum_brightwellii.AAC.1